MRIRPALAILLAATVAMFAGCSKKNDSDAKSSATAGKVILTADQRKNIRLYLVAPSPFHRTIQTNGIVDFDHDQATSVLAPISGPVSRLLVSLGDKVKQGQPLAIIASPDFAEAVSAYRKALVVARNARRLADLDKDLLAHQGVSAREEAQAQTDAASAEADSSAAFQALLALNVDRQTVKNIELGRPIARIEAPIRAPISGIVVEKLISPGQLLQASTTPCFTVADLSRVWVMAQLFGAESAAVNVGDNATVETGTGSAGISGRVENVAEQVDPNTLAVAVRVAVDNPGNRLKKQMYVRVTIEDRRQSSGLLIPVSAILRDDENLPFVYVAEPDGSFSRAHVTLGNRSGDRYDISSGIRAGQRVVADGALFLQFMQDQ